MDEKYDLRHFYDFCTQTFEHSVWRDFLKHWPHQKEMEPYSDGKNRSLEDPGRFGSYLIGYKSNQDLAKIESAKRETIIDFACNQLQPVIKRKLTEYFPLIQTRYGSRLSQLDLDVFAVMVNAQREINVRVHPENPSMILSGIVYIVEPGFEYPTTTLYRCNDGTFSDCGNTFFDVENFREIFSPPSIDNSMLTLAKTDRSFHGVPKQQLPSNKFRRTVNWHVRLTDACFQNLYGVKNFRDLDNNNRQFMKDMRAVVNFDEPLLPDSKRIIRDAFKHLPNNQ